MIHANADTRNLTDELKGKSEEQIVRELDTNGVELEIVIENVERDFNMGSIVRSANAFGVRHVHVIGRKQWNKRGAMATDRYLHVHYHESVMSFMDSLMQRAVTLIAVDNVDGSRDIQDAPLPTTSILVFGSESDGISDELRSRCTTVVAIRQKGSTRSLNVAAAAAVAMYEWSRRQSH